MENKAHALAAGLFVVVVSAMLIAMAVWLTRDSGEYRIYEISSPEAVTGLQPQAAVRYRGVPVGKVTAIGFDPKVVGNVLVQVALDAAAPVSSATFASLGFQGVTGLAFVQLDDAGKDKTPLATSAQAPARIPMRPSLLSRLSDQGVSILARIEQTSERVNALLSEQNQQQVMRVVTDFGAAAQSVQRMAERMNTLSAHVDTVLAAQLGPGKTDIPRLVQDTTATLKALHKTAEGFDVSMADFRKTANAFTDVAQRLNAKGGAVERLTESAAALTHGATALTEAGNAFSAQTLPRINRTSDDTARAARQVNRAVGVVGENPQALIFGNGVIPAGPGEPGFVPPKGKP